MANLRVDKITSTETFETTGSVQFDGSGDLLTVPNSADFRLGNVDFTIECWFLYNSEINSNRTLFSFFENDSVNRRSYQVEIRSDGTIRFEYTTDGSSGVAINSDAIAVDAETWYHYAVTRTDGYITQYLNGKSVSTGYVGTDSFFNNTDDPFRIGGLNAAVDQPFPGHVTNFRVVKGTALYTANFKPPMRELEVVPGTVLLACQSKTDASLEKTGKTVTVVAQAVASELTPGILTPVPKVGGGSAITGSVEFNGTGDCLTAPDGSDFEFGSDDFTIEAYIYYTGSPGTSGDTYVITSKWDNQSAPNDKGLILRISDDGSGDNLQWFYTTDGSTNDITTGSTILIPESWYHIAFVRNGTVGTFYINGIPDATTVSFGSDSIRDTGNPFRIGANLESGAIDQEFQGFISNLRVIKGTALYTDDFIPPTRELKKVPGTVLLCCQDPDNPLTEATGKTITGFGDLNQSYGINLVTNGSFDTDSDWTKGTQWTIVGGAASITDSPDRGSDSLLTQDASSWIQAGQMYRVAVDWSFSSGDFDVRLGGDSDFTEFSIESSHGSPYVFNIEAGATNDNLDIIANQHAVGDINYIRVENVPPLRTGSNFTPQVGDDRKVTFEGVTKINTENYFYLPTGDTVTRDSRYGRGLFTLGAAPSATNTINYVTISSMGNALDFGDLTYTQDSSSGGCSSSTRGVFGGGGPSNRDTICFVTIATTGNATDFGNLTEARRGTTAHSNSTRGIFTAGRADPAGANPVDNIDFITIASTGDAIDFGNLTVARRYPGSTSSPIRGVVAGGFDSSGRVDVMDYITISSTGNAVDFGNLSAIRVNLEGNSDGVRGVFGAGDNGSDNLNIVEYITISSTGNAQDFGDLVNTVFDPMAASNSIRGLYAGGGDPSQVNVIQYITIASIGNANDFGDLTSAGREGSGCSDSHGGLG